MKVLKPLIISLIGLSLSIATAAQTPYDAARAGDLEALRQYRFEGLDLYVPDQRGFTPYELAALHANPNNNETLQRHVEAMLWLKEFHPEKHQYGKATIAFIQASLNALGYSAGSPNGKMDSKTVAAIRSYQRNNDLAETGRPGPQWLGMLYHDSLKDVQYKLTKLGFNTYGSDGKMGAKTQRAMLKFRQKEGLAAPDYPYLDALLISSLNHQFSAEEKAYKQSLAENARQEKIDKTRFAQAGLNATGYRIGRIDGMTGSKTVHAIKSFQQKNGLTATGEVDDETYETMRKAFTKDSQRKLAALGYRVGKPDGKMGNRTIAALRKYRKSHDLSEKGGVDADLLISLQDKYVAAETQRKAEEVQTQHEQNDYRIRYAQAGLRTLGYKVSIDGVAGAGTRKAIKAFQKRYKLSRSGHVDDKTFAKMQTVFLKETQRKLNTLGYTTGKPDGQMGARTKTALKRFRRNTHLSGTGVGADLIAAVDDAYDGRRAGKQTAAPTVATHQPAKAKPTPPKQVAPATASRSSTVKTPKTTETKQASSKATATKQPVKELPITAFQKPAKPTPKPVEKPVAAKTTASKAKPASSKTRISTTFKTTSSDVVKPTTSKPSSRPTKSVTTSKAKSAKTVAKASASATRTGGRSAKGRMSFKRSSGRVVGCSIAGRNIPIEWCEPFYPLPKNNRCEATFKPGTATVVNLWCK